MVSFREAQAIEYLANLLYNEPGDIGVPNLIVAGL